MASSARLDELKKKFDENPRRYFAPLANEHRKSGDLDQAIALCRTHLPQQPGHISGHIVLAQALFEAGSLDESREIFHSALGLDPENLIALRYLGDIAKEARDLDTARSWYQRVLEVDPRNEEIEQLVRDLDAAPPAVEEPTVEEAVAEASSFAPAAAEPSPPPAAAPAEPDARFAPLAIEQVEIDDTFGASSPVAQPNDAPAESLADVPTLDVPDIDPFDLDPAGSADALLDAPTTPSGEDFFLPELSAADTADAAADRAESNAPQPHDSWAPAEAHAEPAGAEAVTEAHLSALDDAAFQLEPPPAEPDAAAEPEVVSSAAPEPAAETSADQIAIPGMDAFAAEYSTGSYEAIPEPEPNEDATEQLANQQTAEWQPLTPAAAADDGLGLEVMEFVPPSSEAPVPVAYPQAPEADPLLGHTLALPTNEPSPPPAAFVTETMAELYLQQGFRNEALAVYRELLSRNPADTSLRDRIDQIENGSISSIGIASVSEDIIESARKRQSGRPPRSVRSFFASLAGRRAPAPREPVETESPVDAASATGDDLSSTQASSGAEPFVVEHADPESETPARREVAARPARTTPIPSAAETLATFDPFADAMEAEPMSASALDAVATPNEPFPEFSAGLTTPSRQTPRSTPAQTPASAFGHSEPQGRPTRAASNELSLDHVFRGAPESAPVADGGFSFDQFFSDAPAAGVDAAAAATAPESGRGGGSADAHDIEQFTAWLEGLKKK